MTFKNTKIQKFISSLLFIAMLAPSLIVFSAPKKVEAAGIPTIDIVGNALKVINNIFAANTSVSGISSLFLQLRELAKTIMREALKAVARRALAEMTKSTVNWINSGFHGKPLFIE
ncbi:MAG: hypothetical protein AAB815_01025, partial [Patescibacteria group bacterium]